MKKAHPDCAQEQDTVPPLPWFVVPPEMDGDDIVSGATLKDAAGRSIYRVDCGDFYMLNADTAAFIAQAVNTAASPAPVDDGGLAETERLHSADCRAQEAQRQREAEALQAGFELGKEDLRALADKVIRESATDPVDEPFYYVRQCDLDALEAALHAPKEP